MDPSGDSELEARLTRLEAAIAGLQQSMDALMAERRPAHPRDPAADARASSRASASPEPPFIPHRRRPGTAGGPDEALYSWFTSHDAGWWLSRVGMGFLVVGVLLLYGYAVNHGWITPPIRVLAGVIVGGSLFWAASRVRSQTTAAAVTDVGFRELLLGGGLAVWYLTAYAAAVRYQLIPIPAARLIFFLLAILSTWIALQEHREIFALVAVVTGFATPSILPAPVDSMTELSLYLGAVTAMGLVIYLLRGWQSILWITFVVFWVSVAQTANAQTYTDDLTLTPITGPAFGSAAVESSRTFAVRHTRSPAQGSIAFSILLLAAAFAFTRVPSLRRQLLTLGSPRYTTTPATSGSKLVDSMNSMSAALGGGKSAPDSLIVWVLMLMSVVLSIALLGNIWPQVPDEIWGTVFVLLGLGALEYFRRGHQSDAEISHVVVTAAVFWILIGVNLLATAPESLPASALVAALVIYFAPRQFAGPRTLAKLTIVIALMEIAGYELSFNDTSLVHARWVASELVTLGAAAFISRRLIANTAERIQGMVLAGASYLVGLIVVWSALNPVWPPLVTTSYAIIGAVLLILSRRDKANSLYMYLGGVTMLIVVGRLLLIDLATVETIWRVLLFLVCGGVFLITAYQMQPGRRSGR